MGLQKDNYVIFELIGHSTDLYEDGKKFEVIHVNEVEGKFIINGRVVMQIKVKN